MDIVTTLAALATGALIGQGGHVQNGYRDTGCDQAAQTAVISNRTGEVLYYMNDTCPMVQTSTREFTGLAEYFEDKKAAAQ